MIEKLKKIRENKALKIFGNIVYGLLVLLVVMIVIVVALQRFSNNTIALRRYKNF